MLNRPLFAVAVFVLLALVPVAAQVLGYPFYVKIGTRIIIWAIASLGLGLVLSWGGMVSMVHAAFMGVAAYAVGLLAWHATHSQPIAFLGLAIPGSTSALVVWPVAIVATAIAAFVIGALSLRTAGLYFIMITLAFGQMLYYFTVALQKYGGDDGTPVARSVLPLGINLANALHLYYLGLALLVVSYVVVVRIVRSPFGMVIQGARQNDRRMKAIGFPTYRYKLACFTVSGVLGGLAGILFVNAEAYMSPAALHWTRSADLVIMVLLGGMTSLIGPVIGAAAYIVLEVFLSAWTNYWQAVLGPLLILIVLFGKRRSEAPAHD